MRGRNNSKTKVSVCIVSYNGRKDIDRCLGSLIELTDDRKIDLDLHIFDNNSVDDSVRYLSKKYPNVKFICSDKNHGFGYGHNQVIEKIDSKYHIILNPDIIFKEDSITKLIDYLNNNDDVAIVTPEIRNFDNTIQHLPKLFPKFRYVMSSTIPMLSKYRDDYTMAKSEIKSPIDIQVCTGSFMMARTDILKKLNGFDDNFFMYFEDFDLSLRTRKFGRVVYLPTTFVHHKWQRDTKKSKKMFMISLRSMIKFYRKHLWKPL